MPTGIYTRTKEHNSSISVGLKKRNKLNPNPGNFKKGHIPAIKGKKLSKEICEKFSSSHKGYKMPEEQKKKISNSMKGKNIWMKGRKLSQETRLKMSLNLRGKYTGSNSHKWKGGTSSLRSIIYSSYKTRQWRSDIFTRDSFICQNCGIKNGKDKTVYFEAHHIKPFYKILEENNIKTLEEALMCEELWNINNGITLCRVCHEQTKNGRSKKDVEEALKDIKSL